LDGRTKKQTDRHMLRDRQRDGWSRGHTARAERQAGRHMHAYLGHKDRVGVRVSHVVGGGVVVRPQVAPLLRVKVAGTTLGASRVAIAHFHKDIHGFGSGGPKPGGLAMHQNPSAYQPILIPSCSRTRSCEASTTSLKPIGYTWSYLACRIGHVVPVYRPRTRSCEASTQLPPPQMYRPRRCLLAHLHYISILDARHQRLEVFIDHLRPKKCNCLTMAV
jgi:hypothetical protein